MENSNENNYFDSNRIIHVPVTERINHTIKFKQSFFDENGYENKYRINMDNIFGICPPVLSYPTFCVLVDSDDDKHNYEFTRLSLLSAEYHNIAYLDRMRLNLKFTMKPEDLRVLNHILSSKMDIVENPIIDPVDITVYQYMLFIYNTGVINITPSRRHRLGKFESAEYVLSINSSNLEDVKLQHHIDTTNHTGVIPMDTKQPNYVELDPDYVESYQ